VIPTSGPLGPNHLAGLLFEQATGTMLRMVHLESGAAQIKMLMAKDCDAALATIGTREQRVIDGEFRLLAIFDSKRLEAVPNVPTATELGFPTLVMGADRGYLAPKGLPAPVLDKLEAAFAKGIKNQEHIAKMTKAGFSVRYWDSKEFTSHIKAMDERIKPLMELAKQRA